MPNVNRLAHGSMCYQRGDAIEEQSIQAIGQKGVLNLLGKVLVMMRVILIKQVGKLPPGFGRLHGIRPKFPVEMSDVHRHLAMDNLVGNKLAVSDGIGREVGKVAIGKCLRSSIVGALQQSKAR